MRTKPRRLADIEFLEPPSNEEIAERLFPPGTGRREIAVQAVGNLIAAYVILIAACVVGVGDYTPQLRYWVVVGTGGFLIWLVSSGVSNIVVREIEQGVNRRLKKDGLRLANNYLRRNLRNLVFFLVFGAIVLPLVLVSKPLLVWTTRTTGFAP